MPLTTPDPANECSSFGPLGGTIGPEQKTPEGIYSDTGVICGTDTELRRIESNVESFCRLQARAFRTPAARFNTVVSMMHRLCADLDELESQGIARALLSEVVRPAVELQSQSPFIRRLQTQPRGYPGDFETIECILCAQNNAPSDTLAHCFEQYALNAAPAYQHRNKIHAQASLLREVCSKKKTPRILVLAAGGGADLKLVLRELQASNATLVVNDIDPEAIRLCQVRLAALGERVTYRLGNALLLIREFAKLGPFDLITAGGLFDYVPQERLQRFLRRLLQCLDPQSGCFFFTNIASGNPYRTWMRYFANWELFERTEEDVRQLFPADDPTARLEITRDVSGLSLMVAWRRGDWLAPTS